MLQGTIHGVKYVSMLHQILCDLYCIKHTPETYINIDSVVTFRRLERLRYREQLVLVCHWGLKDLLCLKLRWV